MATSDEQVPTLVPVSKPLSLIPVGLKEAALDSPTFRATAVHFSDQVDAVERWLDSYVRAASRLAQEASSVDSLINTFLATSSPPNYLSEAIIDHDYTYAAMHRFGEDARDFWTHIVAGMTKIQGSIVEPVRSFLTNDSKPFKDARRQLESSQKQYDALLARYYSQTKSKESSALREDAFQVHEARKLYLKASMDFCVLAPQLHTILNSLLIEIFSDQWLDMKTVREASTLAFAKHATEINRIRHWSREVGQSEYVSKSELILARRDIEAAAEANSRPSRDLDDYGPSLNIPLDRRPPAVPFHSDVDSPATRQGWLFLKTLTGKPSRTAWIRRWFFVNNGVFGWLVQGSRSGGVEESEKIGVLLCNVRAAIQEERRFCFEVKTKDTTILLQAENQTDLTQWLSVFEAAKHKAFDQPAIDDPSASGLYSNPDAAFAVNPATAPEFAARKPDGQIARITEDLIGPLHSLDNDSGPATTQRQNVDINAAKKILEKTEGEKNRDHAARLIQKLDLHRKTSATAQLSGGTAGGSSTPSLPSSPRRIEPSLLDRRDASSIAPTRNHLAPSTLANPPAPTNLSKTAVMIGAEKGLDLGVVDKTGGVPSGIMANQWGTVNHGHISRLERGEVKRHAERPVSIGTAPNLRRMSDPPSPENTTTPMPFPDVASQLSPPGTPSRTRSVSAVTDNSKAASDTEDHPPPRKAQTGFADYPSFYPHDLKAHDAQFRMLFPNVSPDDRVVLVFRASWNPDDRQNLPGRVFVTMNDMYFYSNHFGFILVSGVDLSSVADISSSSSESHDLLYLRVDGRSDYEEATLITIKTFLEPVKLLRQRLNFLASNCSAEEPVGLQEVLQHLLKLESEFQSDKTDHWDELSHTQSGSFSNQLGSTQKTEVRIDRNLYGGDPFEFGVGPESIKFRLPTEPVMFTPKDMSKVAAEQTFNTSAKALFHIIFGDRSVISQMLYLERRTETIKQNPWTRGDDNYWRRQFEYEANAESLVQHGKISVVDTQSIDLANDHLCYVVSDTKVPWHLPYGEQCLLVTKIVITHVAKSKCHLKVFIKVAWKQKPYLSWRLIQRHGMNDLRVDGQNLLALVSDQVQKLGPNCTTKRAIQIFGHLGQHSEGAVVTAADLPIAGRQTPVMIHRRALSILVLEAVFFLVSSTARAILMSFIGICTTFYGLISAHAVLFFLFASSAFINFIGTTQMATSWWQDHKAVSFMSQLGVGPNVVMSKAVYMHDINEMLTKNSDPVPGSNERCSTTFKQILANSDIDAPIDTASTPYSSVSTKSTARRLRNTRQHMGTYRHDLLVSLRLVNSIEREAVQAEYENWLIEEFTNCRRIGKALQNSNDTSTGYDSNATKGEKSGENAKDAAKLASKLGHENVLHLREWYADYCGSCYAEHGTVFPKNNPNI